LKSPRFTQSTDEFFFTASNQIVNDLRKLPRHRKIGNRLQASKLEPGIYARDCFTTSGTSRKISFDFRPLTASNAFSRPVNVG
jgi:hypothetical protein